MTRKLRRTLEAVWYAAGPAQFLLYGFWTVIVSGLVPLDDVWQLIPTTWKFNGVLIVAFTIWGSLRQKKILILIATFQSIVVGAVFTSKAVVFTDVDIVRAATQSHYMILFLLVFWGFYLANLAARQEMEFKRVGVDE
jgi:hypothetical protein